MKYCAECDHWKIASGLEIAGDPDLVTPEMLQRYLGRLTEAVGRYLSETGACENSTGDESLCHDPDCSYCAMERALEGIKGCGE